MDQSTHSSGTINIIVGEQVIELHITATQDKTHSIMMVYMKMMSVRREGINHHSNSKQRNNVNDSIST